MNPTAVTSLIFEPFGRTDRDLDVPPIAATRHA
jgi:hypothetical protein